MAEERISILAYLKDKVSPKVGKIATGVKYLGKTLKVVGTAGAKSFGMLGRVLKSIKGQIFNLRNLMGGAAVGVVVKQFASFEREMANVYTLLDDAPAHMENFERGVKHLAKTTGESMDDLAKALFDAISAGVAPGGAIQFLEKAAKLAIAGNTDIANSTKGLVAVLNSYSLGVEHAEDVSDSLFKAMKGGITTIERMAASMGMIAPAAALAGISYDEMNAALATITKTAMPTEQAVTALLNTITVLLGPQEDSLKLAEQLAKKFPELNFELSIASLRTKGLARWFADLATATGEDAEVMKKLIPNIRAYKGVAVLAANGAKVLGQMIEEQGRKAGTTAREFKKVEITLMHQMKQLKATFLVLLIEIGAAMKPFLESTIGKLRAAIDYVTTQRATIQAWVTQIIRTAKQLVTIVKTLVAQLDIVPALVNSVVVGMTILVRVFWAALPMLLTTITLIGKQLGFALMTALIGASKERFAKDLASGNTTWAGEIAAKLGLGADKVAELRAYGKEINRLEQALQNLIRAKEAAARAGAPTKQERDMYDMGLQPTKTGNKAVDEQLALNKLARFDPEALAQKIATASARIAELREELGGAITDGTLDADKERLREQSAEFIKDVGTAIAEELPGLTHGLAPESRAAINRLMDMWGQQFNDRLKEAAGKDATANLIKVLKKTITDVSAEVAATGSEMGGAFGGIFSGLLGGDDTGLSGPPSINIEKTVEGIKEQFTILEERMELFRQRRDEARGMEEDGVIFSSEALRMETEALAKMKEELASFDGVLEMFIGRANEADAATLKQELRDVLDKLEKIRKEMKDDKPKGNFLTGLASGAKKAAEQLGDLKTLGAAVGASLVNDLSDFFVNMFDKGSQSFEDFLKTFLKGIAKMIAKALIARAIMSAFGWSSANKGGRMGFAIGGPVPGPDVNQDVIPAMLTPGEFVIPRKSVEHYGAGAMEAIRRRMLPRSSLATHGRPSPRVVKREFATGGEVVGDDGPMVQRAVVVADEESFGHLLAGGRRAMMDFFGTNADEIRRVLGGAPA